VSDPVPLDHMTSEQEEQFLRELERDDDTAARMHLAAGRPITYREADTPPGHVIKKYPDGRRVLVRVVEGGEQPVRDLSPA
jgi:hypothetical protein